MRNFALIAVLALSSTNFAVAGPLERIRERRESRVETRHHEPVSVVVDKDGKPALLLSEVLWLLWLARTASLLPPRLLRNKAV